MGGLFGGCCLIWDWDIRFYLWRVMIFFRPSLAVGCSFIKYPILDRGAVHNYHDHSIFCNIPAAASLVPSQVIRYSYHFICSGFEIF